MTTPENEAAELEEWRKKSRSSTFPRLPDGVEVDDETYDLHADAQRQYEAFGPGSQEGEEARYVGERLIQKIKEAAGIGGPIVGPPKMTRTYTDPRGRIVTAVGDGMGPDLGPDRVGHVIERHVVPKEESQRLIATEQLRADEGEAIKTARWQVDQLRLAAANTSDPDAKESLRQRADELSAATDARREALINAIVERERTLDHDEHEIGQTVRSYGFAYTPLEPGVAEALELVKAGKITEAYDHFAERDDKGRRKFGNHARYQFFEKVDDNTREQLLTIESDRREARARFLREGGML
jgi:hypothetical protein